MKRICPHCQKSSEPGRYDRIVPVVILLTSFNRAELLKKTVDLINERTFYPYRIIAIDNASTDGSVGILKAAKVQGKIFDHILLEENIGQSKALNIGFADIQKWENGDGRPTRPSNDFFITTNDDIYPPMLGQKNCWLRRMITLLEKNEPEYGGLCMRIQRTARTDIDETKDVIPCYKGFPSVFRLMRRSDYEKLGDRPFGRLLKWDSNTSGDKFRYEINKKFGFTTHIYADHAGYMGENRGYPKGFIDYHTYAANKTNIQNEKPYADIDPLTNVPTKINHLVDKAEHDLREANKK